ncbi:MAG: S8 family serine peptidase [Pseudomonadota bacterium]
MSEKFLETPFDGLESDLSKADRTAPAAADAPEEAEESLLADTLLDGLSSDLEPVEEEVERDDAAEETAGEARWLGSRGEAMTAALAAAMGAAGGHRDSAETGAVEAVTAEAGVESAAFDMAFGGPAAEAPTAAAAPAASAEGGAEVRGEGGSFDTELLPTLNPLFNSQWHLRNTTAGQFDINVVDVWDDYTGDGISVTVIDNGFDTTHEDFAGNYLFATDYDYQDGDFFPGPTGSQNHGTAVMGIIGAADNSVGGVGVAFDVDIRGYRGLAFSVLEDQILDAAGEGDGVGNTNGNANGSDVVNMSFGLSEDVFNTNADLLAAVDALETGSENGRSGLGTIYVKSNGNSRDNAGSSLREEATAEAMDSTKYTINVAALRQDGWVTDFSTPGANLLVSGLADDLNNNGAIVTTDRTGAPGYTSGNYTSTFGGTSSAAPEVAGVVALMLEANPDLGWRDVQKILAYSARHVGSDVGSLANSGAPIGGAFEQATQTNGSTWFWNAADNWNGGGLHFSNDYGYGLVDALAAVRLAETWQQQSTSANDAIFFRDMDGVNVTTVIAGGGGNNFTGSFGSMTVEHVELDLNFETDFLADLEIFLISPSGTRVQLIADTGDSGDFDGSWDFGTTAFMGEDSSGTWTVNIRDDLGGFPITVTDVDLFISGSTLNASDNLFIFTNEFSDYDGVAGHGTNFSGTGVTDTINAAAVSSNSVVNLLANSGTIDGVAITNSAIERVYTGDGNDTILGDAFSEYLDGGRGNDSITGGSAAETIVGGAGNDVLIGGNGDDTLQGLDGNDTLEGGGGDDLMQGGNGSDTFRYQNGADATSSAESLQGGSGTDRLLVQGAGTFSFGVGADMFNVNSIEEIEFAAENNVAKTIVLGNKELDSASEFLNVQIDGNATIGGADTIIVNIDYEFNDDVNLSNWNFIDFGSTTSAIFGDLDSIFINGNDQDNTIVGSSEDDDIDGNQGDDTIQGGNGDDTIDGGTGVDSILGGAGNDHIRDSDNINVEFHSGGAGFDTIDYSGSTYSDDRIIINLATGTTTVVNPVGNTSTISGFENVIGSGANETVIGAAVANMLEGRGGDDSILGGGGGDTLEGGAGNDTLDGEGAADTVRGGAGDDVMRQAVGSVDEFDGGTGNDTIESSAVYADGVEMDLEAGTYVFTPGSFTRSWTNVENYIGTGGGDEDVFGTSGANLLQTGVGDNELLGRAGNDTLIGGGGNDTIDGGAGTDSVLAGSGDDIVSHLNAGSDFYDGGLGNDTLVNTIGLSQGVEIDLEAGTYTFNAFTLDWQNFENYDGSGSSASSSEDVFGTNGANNIATAGGTNLLDGRGGNDTLAGGGGDDTLIGGSGNDTMFGGQGDDLFIFELGWGSDDVNGGAGTDTVDFSAVAGPGTGIEIDIGVGYSFSGGPVTTTFSGIENAVGSGFDDLITGTGVGNDIEGGVGDDTILGGGGQDTVDAGGGADEVDGGNGLDMIVGGSGGDTLGGGAGGDTIEGDNGNDVIFGDDGNDFIFGDGGDDTVEGGSGNDNISGGVGADDISGGTDDDVIEGQGDDDVLRGQGGDDFVRGGGGNDDVRGGGNNDNIFGSIGEDTLSGGQGDDSARGGQGDDIVAGDAGNDDLFGQNGNDTVLGGSGDDTLRGNNGNDELDGGTGFDIMTGGNGMDTFVFNSVADSPAGASQDVITDWQRFVDTIDLSGIDANTLIGGNQAFTFIGGANFSAAGQVRYFTDGTDGFLLANVDGGLSADFAIELEGFNLAFSGGDLIL